MFNLLRLCRCLGSSTTAPRGRGFAAAQCGKGRPYRAGDPYFVFLRLSLSKKGCLSVRQSRKKKGASPIRDSPSDSTVFWPSDALPTGRATTPLLRTRGKNALQCDIKIERQV